MSAIDALFTYVEGRYSRLAQARFVATADTTKLSREAVAWCWQDSELHPVANRQAATGAVILDPQIGVCAYFQEFARGTDVRGQLSRALKIRSALLPTRQAPKEEVD